MVAPAEEYAFWQEVETTIPNKSGFRVRGSTDPAHAGNYTTRDGSSIVDAYNNDFAGRSDEVLELMGLINQAYHQEDKKEFDDLVKTAETLFTDKSMAALRVYNW